MSKLIKNLEKFKMISFDLTDTLVRFKRPPAIEYAETATALGFPNVDAAKLSAQFPDNFKKMNIQYPNFGRNKIGWEDFWEILIANTFKSAGTPLSVDDAYRLTNVLIDKFETEECYELQDGAVELIEKIKGIDKLVAVVSNFDPRLKFLIENMKLPEIDIVVGSYEVGVAKPDPRIYDVAIKLSYFKAMPDESLHIGNTPELDYIAAKEAEWTSALITNGKSDWLLHKEKINENHVFESLRDFITKLENDDIEWGESTSALGESSK